MRFKIAHHSGHAPGHAPPTEALDLLMERLGPRREGVSFAKVGSHITATWTPEMSSSTTHDERVEMGRRVVLAIVQRVAGRDPDLDAEWFAISEIP